MPHIVVVGDGAVGTAVAVALSCTGMSVTLAGPVGTGDRRVLFTAHGFIEGTAELFHTAVDGFHAASTVVAALKAFDIRKAVPYIKKTGCNNVICLSNGMGLEEEWGELSGIVEYAVLTMGFRKHADRSVTTTAGSVYCQSGGSAERVFTTSGIPVEEVENIVAVRWAKWYANSVINPVGALSGHANNKILKHGLQPLVTALSAELSRLMPSAEALEQGQKLLEWLLNNSANRCSMLQDVAGGRSTEISFLTGLCKRMPQGDCPIASALTSLIKSKEITAG